MRENQFGSVREPGHTNNRIPIWYVLGGAQ